MKGLRLSRLRTFLMVVYNTLTLVPNFLMRPVQIRRDGRVGLRRETKVDFHVISSLRRRGFESLFRHMFLTVSLKAAAWQNGGAA